MCRHKNLYKLYTKQEVIETCVTEGPFTGEQIACCIVLSPHLSPTNTLYKSTTAKDRSTSDKKINIIYCLVQIPTEREILYMDIEQKFRMVNYPTT